MWNRMSGWIGVVCATLLVAVSSIAAAQTLEISPLGVGDASTLGTVKAFGSANERVELELPPNRLGPSLVLEYSSLSSTLKSLGLGWSIEAGRIERSTENGVPATARDDEFVFSLGSSSSKILSVSSGRYRAETESEYRTYTRSGGGWEVRDAGGIRYVFGTTDATRVSGSDGDGGEWTVVWLIERIEDPNGNIVTFQHQVLDNVPYLTEITLNGHLDDSVSGPTRIQLTYEPRPQVRISYRLGVRQEFRRRLAEVAMTVEGALVRRYLLDYTQSDVSGRSLLGAVRMRGTTDGSALRVREYGYTRGAVGWDPASATSMIPVDFHDAEGKDQGVLVADVDGDARGPR